MSVRPTRKGPALIYILIASWLILSLIVAVIASGKGRSGIGFFILSLLATPIITLVILIVVGEGPGPESARSSVRKCPFCAELVNKEAKDCKHCKRDLPEYETANTEDSDMSGEISSIEEGIDSPTNLATKLLMFAASIAMIAGGWSMKTSSVAGSGDAGLAWLFIFAGLIFLKITSEETDDS